MGHTLNLIKIVAWGISTINVLYISQHTIRYIACTDDLNRFTNALCVEQSYTHYIVTVIANFLITIVSFTNI
jgi:hypothetical protein